MKPPALRTEGIGKHERYGALMEVVRRRYTCRAFAPYEVPREHYELILEAAPPRALRRQLPALALHYRDRSGKALCHRADHQADLSRMWSVITGFLSLTEHPPATINVQHVERGTTHRATLTKGNFLIGLPVVRGTNTLRWHLQVARRAGRARMLLLQRSSLVHSPSSVSGTNNSSSGSAFRINRCSTRYCTSVVSTVRFASRP